MAATLRVQGRDAWQVFTDLAVMIQTLFAREKVHLGVELKVFFGFAFEKRHHQFSDRPRLSPRGQLALQVYSRAAQSQ